MSADFSHSGGIDLASQPDFEIGRLRVRPNLRQVETGSDVERLEPRVMQALVALAERPGEVVSRDALLERCWAGRIVGDDAINRCMMKLRKVGEEHGAFAIEAVPRIGYRMVIAEQGGPDVQARGQAGPRRWLWPALSAVAIAVAALVAVVLWRAAPAPLSIQTPFIVAEIAPIQADEPLKAFAVATVSDINAALSRYRLPTTPAGGASFDIRGLVTREAGRTHARLTMVALPSGTTIWTSEFDAPVDEEAILHARIASRVASVAGMVNELLVRPSSDFDAVTLALLIKGVDGIGNNTWDSRTGPEEAVRRSPRSAVAHANYGIGLVVAAGFVPPDKGEPLRRRGIAELNRALALDPQTPEAVFWLGLLIDGRDWNERLKFFSQASMSENVYAKLARGALLSGAGRVEEGMLPLADAMERLGERPGRQGMMIYAVLAAGRDASALDRARKYSSLMPGDYGLRRVLLDLVALQADPAEALAILDDPKRRGSYSTASLEAYRRFLHWRKDGSPASRAAAITAITAATKVGLAPENAVPMLVRLGDLDAAFAAAEARAEPAMLATGPPYNAAFLYFTATASMRRDPRFIQLADKLGLLAFWQETGSWPDFCRSEPDSICAQMQMR